MLPSSDDQDRYKIFIISSLSHACPNCRSNPHGCDDYACNEDRGIEVRKVKVISDNGDKCDDDEGSHSLKSKESKLVCRSHDLPVIGTKPVLINCVLRQMSVLQAAVEAEANVDSGSDDVLDGGDDFDALNE